MRSSTTTKAVAFLLCWLSVLASATGFAVAGQEFDIEDNLSNPKAVPASVSADIEKNLTKEDKACFTDAGTTPHDALEATSIDLGSSVQALLLRPKLPDDPKAAYGCYCGTATCPMWIYSIEGGTTRRIWSSVTYSLKILERKDLGSKRLLASDGTAGHESATVYTWNGQEYTELRGKSFFRGQGKDADKRAEQGLAKFRTDAAH